MAEYNYRRLPLVSCVRSPPSKKGLGTVRPLYFNVDGQICRAWKSIAEFCTAAEVMIVISLVSRTAYMASRDDGVWRELLLSNYTEDMLWRVLNEDVKIYNPLTQGCPYREEMQHLREAAGWNCDKLTEKREKEILKGLQTDNFEDFSQHAVELDKGVNFDLARQILYCFTCWNCYRPSKTLLNCPVRDRNICLKCRLLPKYMLLSKSSTWTKYFTIPENLLDFRNVVMVKNPHIPGGPQMQLFYDGLVAKYLNKIQDPGYMRYKALADKLKENGYEDAIELIYGKRIKTYFAEQTDIDFAYDDIIARYQKRKNPVVKKHLANPKGRGRR